MRAYLLVSAAIALMIAGPAYAANSPKDAAQLAVHKDDGAAARVAPVVHDDDTSNVILLDQDSIQALPNPYANPAPRMISDVWAMRT